MLITTAYTISSFIKMVILGGLMLATGKRLTEQKPSMTLLMFGLAMLSGFLSEIYWFLNAVIKDDYELPMYSATTIGISGLMLLFAACIVEMMPKKERIKPIVYLGCGLFTFSNCGLWYAWSGNFLGQLATAIILGYLLLVVVQAIIETENLTMRQWTAFYSVVVVLIVAEIVMFYSNRVAYVALNILCYGIWFAGTMNFMILGIKRFKNEADKSAIAFFAGFTWSVFAMYMSSSYPYAIAESFCGLFCILIFLALSRREATE